MIEPYIYDAFISYIGADQAWVQGELLPRLAAAGLRYALSDLAAATTPAPWRQPRTAFESRAA